MRNPRIPIFAYLFVLICLATLVCMLWVNYQIAAQNIGGRDFLIQWTGIRSLATEGVSPYSEIVNRRIAAGLEKGPSNSSLDSYSSPLFAGLLVLPFAMIKDFTLAYTLWLFASEIGLVFLVWRSIRLAGWKPGWKGLLFFWLFSFASVYSFAALAFGSLAVMTALLLVLCLQALWNQRDELAGMLMALAFIQPEAVLLVGIYAILWTASRRRWAFIAWFIGGFVLLSLLGVLIIPTWPIQYFQVIWHWAHLEMVQTPGAIFLIWWPGLGKQMGWGMTILLSLLLAGEWLVSLSKDSEWFLWTACLTLVVSQWIGIPTSISNEVLLILPLALIFANWQARIGRQSIWLIGGSILILLLGLWLAVWRFLSTGTNGAAFYFFFFPLPLIALIGLYWVRWWAIRPQKLPVEGFSLSR